MGWGQTPAAAGAGGGSPVVKSTVGRWKWEGVLNLSAMGLATGWRGLVNAATPNSGTARLLEQSLRAGLEPSSAGIRNSDRLGEHPAQCVQIFQG
jgi:hypothetical protein